MTERRANKRQILLLCFALAAVTAVVFWPLRDHEFINYDDTSYVTENPHVQSGLTLVSLRWAFTTYHAGYWHPLTWLSHMLDYQIAGLHPSWHHTVSLFIHTANTLLLFLLFYLMTNAFWRCAFLATLFALHPLHVESVAWIAERKDVLSTLFFFLSIGAYVYYLGRKTYLRYGMLLGFFILGLMSKPMVVTLPFVLLLLDYWPLGRLKIEPRMIPATSPRPSRRKTKKQKAKDLRHFPEKEGRHDKPSSSGESALIGPLLREKVPLFVLSALSSGLTFYHQKAGGAMLSLDDLPLAYRLANACVSYATYIGKMIVPRDLSVFYPHQVDRPVWMVAGAVLLLLIITLFILSGARRRSYLAVGWFWYLGTLVPVIGVVQVGLQAMADRYTYIPLIGLFIVIAWGLPDLLGARRWKKEILSTAGLVALIGLAVTTRLHLPVWKDSTALFRHALSVTRDNALSRNNLAIALRAEGKMEEAESHYRQAMRLQPGNEQVHYNLANLLLARGEAGEAITHYQSAIAIKPRYGKAHANLGVALNQQGRFDEARWHYRQAIALGGADVKIRYNYGMALFEAGMAEEALSEFKEAIRQQPNFAEAYNEVGRILAMGGRTGEAIDYFETALRLKPGFSAAEFNLGIARSALGR